MQSRGTPLRGPRLRLAAVALPAAVALFAMALSRVTSTSSAALWDIAWTASAISAVAGMLFARRAASPHDRARWTLWAAAAGCWLLGQLIWNLYGLIGFPPSPNPADVSWWAFGVLVMASLLRSRAASRSVRVVALAETVPVTFAAIALTLGELWHHAAVSTLATSARVSALVYPTMYIAVTVLMLQAMIGGTLRHSRSMSQRLVFAGIAAQAVAFTLWSTQLLAGTYVPGRTFLDPLWVVGLVTIGVGGLFAAHRPDRLADDSEPSQRGGLLPSIMFALLLGGLLHAHLTHAGSGAAIMIGSGVLLSGTALIVRGVLLERRLRVMLGRERAALVIGEEREAELARLNAQLREDTRRDALTGMRNRRALADDLVQFDSHRREHGEGFAVALCDVDHFKSYNDRLGHLAGDQALRTIAATVRGALREGDIAYRYGGEELLLTLRDVDIAQATAACERVRAAVQRAALAHPDGGGEPLTVSIGVAAGDDDPGVLIARADAAMYSAKRGGRNQTMAAAEEDVAAPLSHRPLEEPVPRHLRGMLAVSRAAAAGQGPMPVLQALAETIRSELSFHVVAVNVLDRVAREMRCVIVLGDDEARQKLEGTSSPASEWEALLGTEYVRAGAIWLPAGTPDWGDTEAMWTPATAAGPDPNSWHPDDMLLLPLRGQDGEILGMISVDQPANGLRPDDGQIAYLMSVADHAALGMEQSRREVERSEAVVERSAELRLAAVMLLAETLDLRDPGTARHSQTVGAYARRTAVALGLADERVERIHAAGVVHDLGKLGIADAILYKPGPLDDQEWREMKRHPEIGARILQHAGLGEIAGWVRAHHERVDGRGYPEGLAGEEIALEARILAVADAYEAMIADRPYRPGMPPASAREELEHCAGEQFDPAVVEAFLQALEDTQAPAAPQATQAPGAEPAVGALAAS